MTKPSFYDKLTDEEKKEYDESIKVASKTKKESYVLKNFDLWKKFLQGDARTTDFARESKTATSEHQYYFTRNGRSCFQYKSFVADMLEGIALVDGLNSQRKSMMKYELVKFLKGQRTSTAGDKPQEPVAKTKPSISEQLNEAAKSQKEEKKRQQAVIELNEAGKEKAITTELNDLAKIQEFKKKATATRPSFEQMGKSLADVARTPDGKKYICPFDSHDRRSDKWLSDHPTIDPDYVVFQADYEEPV